VYVFLFVVFVFFFPTSRLFFRLSYCLLFPLFQMGLRIAFCVFAKSPRWASGISRLWPIDLHSYSYNANYSHVHPR
jgi:hypothetical protein